MTYAEIERAIKSKKRVMKLEAQEKASYDYILADLIGQSVSRIYGSSNKFPDIVDVYPSIFEKDKVEQLRQQQKLEQSAQRFKQFAESFNEKFKKKKEVAKDNERAT